MSRMAWVAALAILAAWPRLGGAEPISGPVDKERVGGDVVMCSMDPEDMSFAAQWQRWLALKDYLVHSKLVVHFDYWIPLVEELLAAQIIRFSVDHGSSLLHSNLSDGTEAHLSFFGDPFELTPWDLVGKGPILTRPEGWRPPVADPKQWRRRRAGLPWDPPAGDPPKRKKKKGGQQQGIDPLVIPLPPEGDETPLVRRGVGPLWEAAADALQSRLAREVDPNSPDNASRTTEELRTRTEVALILMDMLDGHDPGVEGRQFLRDHLDQANALLDAVATVDTLDVLERAIAEIVSWLRTELGR